MPSLVIHFPEKEAASTLVLKGSRISVGRRPSNTIQILDRTLSAAHAEFIVEADGHYRLHDLGSTNGTRVNGEEVCDFQLLEPCTINFGAVECEFNPETASDAAEGTAEVLPTRSEMAALQDINLELRKNLELLRERIATLQKTVTGSAEASTTSALSAELQQVELERSELKEKTQRQEREFAHLQTELAVNKRNRLNLENALRDARAENDRLKKESIGSPMKMEESPIPAAAAAPAVPVAPAAPPAPVAPASPAAPLARPLPPPSSPKKTVKLAEPIGQPTWPKVTAPSASPLAPAATKPTLPPPSAPSLTPEKSPASTGAPNGRPIPKFKTVAPPGGRE